MLMATKVRRWTRADLARLPDDGNRYEVLDGELFVTPQASFPHQIIATRFLAALLPYVDRHGLGAVVGPGGVVFDESELQPDVLVAPVPPGRLPEKWEDVPRPLFVAEILSRTTRRRDLEYKRDAYLRLGIPEYWVIDRFDRRAFVWSRGASESAIFTTELRWQPRDDLEPLVIPLSSVLLPVSARAPIGDAD